jgi:cell shape-determining protein MreC
MGARTKRIVLFIVLAFVLYAVVTSPEQAASYVQDAFFLLADAVQSVFTFFSSLLQ